jgi:hypothetical protein
MDVRHLLTSDPRPRGGGTQFHRARNAGHIGSNLALHHLTSLQFDKEYRKSKLHNDQFLIHAIRPSKDLMRALAAEFLDEMQTGLR